MYITDNDMLKYLKAVTYTAYCSSLTPSINNTKYFSYINNININDLVMEISTIYHTDQDLYRFGFLISDKFEPIYPDNEWELIKHEWLDEDTGEIERPKEKIY